MIPLLFILFFYSSSIKLPLSSSDYVYAFYGFSSLRSSVARFVHVSPLADDGTV